MLERHGHVGEGGEPFDAADVDRVVVGFAHDLLEFQVDAGGEVVVAVAHVDQGGVHLAGTVHIGLQGLGRGGQVLCIGMGLAGHAQSRAAQSQPDKGRVARLQGANGPQRADKGDQVVELLAREGRAGTAL